MWTRKLSLLFASLLLSAPGCEGKSLDQCTTNADCLGDGQICLDGRCAAVADGDADLDGDADGDLDGDTDSDGDADGDEACPLARRCGAEPLCCAEGEDCVEGQCLPPCASGLRCGPSLTCCAEGNLCLAEVCVTPGASCTEAMECDAEEYCEPLLGRCLPRTDGRCEYHPASATFEPREQWAWSASEVAPESVHVMMAPVVGDLDGDGVPEVLFITYNATESYGGSGVLRIVRGDTGEELRSITDPVVCGDSGIALGDLDGDGEPEIVTAGTCRSGPLLAFHRDGTLVWQSHDGEGAAVPVNLDFGAPSIADLEGDGLAEVVTGGAVFEHDGLLRWSQRIGAGGNCCPAAPRSALTALYDMDLDGALEVVAGNAVWRADGTALWDRPELVDGFVAVADFFADGTPDVVVVHEGALSIRAGATGDPLWGPELLPGGGRGGPPTVADFDGDALPEVGVAGSTRYAVYDPDGPTPILWEFVTEDDSSNITGSSVFDFDGDGSAEVVYNDECFMRVFSGADGTILAQVAQNSHTLIEYPLIVDVDADGNAEIVFAANDAVHACSQSGSEGYDGLRHGLRVFGDSLDNWVGTRTVWNQHTYHITNIRQDLSVPTSETPNSLRFNNFRQNSQSFDAPDLVPETPTADTRGCPTAVVLSAEVRNAGAASVGPGLAVTFYLGTPEGEHRPIGTARTEAPLVPGATATLSVTYPLTSEELGLDLSFFVRADDAGDGVGENNECLETNNVAGATFFCEGLG